MMTGTSRSSADLDPRRRRILVRAWRRGIREMDLILGGFADRYIDKMDDDQLDVFENLMLANDVDLIGWFSGAIDVPEAYNTDLFKKIRNFDAIPFPNMVTDA